MAIHVRADFRSALTASKPREERAKARDSRETVPAGSLEGFCPFQPVELSHSVWDRRCELTKLLRYAAQGSRATSNQEQRAGEISTLIAGNT